MRFPKYRPMIEAATERRALGWLALGIVTVIAVTFAWIVGVVGLSALGTGAPLDAAAAALLRPNAATPGGTALYLFLVTGLGMGTLLAARVWHRRTVLSLTGPPARLLRHFAVAALACWTAMAIVALALMSFIGRPDLNLDPLVWLAWLPVGLLVVALQSGSEELLFRGYLQSQIAARFRKPAVWIVVPAFLFGAVHFVPSLPWRPALSLVLVATVFGLLAADLTARTGSIGAAWGFHFANNSLAILLITSDNTLSGLGLFRATMPFSHLITTTPLVAVEVLTLAAIWALVRRLLTA